MFRRLSLRTNLLLVIAAVAIMIMIFMILVADSIGRKHILENAFNNLKSLREIKAEQIKDYITTSRNQIVSLSDDRTVVEALDEFTNAFNKITDDRYDLGVDQKHLVESLNSYYGEKFLPALKPNTFDEVYADEFIPSNFNAQYLQYLYVSNNPYPPGEHHKLTATDSPADYASIHEKYHDFFRSYLERFGYYDIFLVDSKTGSIVYSVFKEVDFATSLKFGPYSKIELSGLFQRASSSSYKGYVEMIDFEPYKPSYNAPASFLASPIFDRGENIGVLIFQMPIEKIDRIMTFNYSWDKVGLGQSGETYIIGPDFKLRNQSRFMVESKQEYLDAIKMSGTSSEVLDKIDNLNTTIGLQSVRSEGAVLANRGESGQSIFKDYRGIEVLSSYGPLDIPDLKWSILSEIDRDEALAAIEKAYNRGGITLLFVVPLIFLLAYYFSKSISNRIKYLSESALNLADGDLEVEIKTSGSDEISSLANSFEKMRVSIRKLVDKQNKTIEELSASLIPMTDDIGMMVLIGSFDEHRIDLVRKRITEDLSARFFQIVIIDISNIPSFDEHTSKGIIKIAKTAKLMGCKIMISGIHSKLASTITELEIDMDGLITQSTLQNAIDDALNHIKISKNIT